MKTAAATILINGTVGVGKTTTASALAVLLRELDVPHAVIDTDEIRRSWPAPPGVDLFGPDTRGYFRCSSSVALTRVSIRQRPNNFLGRHALTAPARMGTAAASGTTRRCAGWILPFPQRIS